ncbi:MAG TPA: phosphate ABC transporter substrate-binding protein PstS [Thermoplasmata archaeon]|nr:phosphate ABC transporter substrate-binding protein PstS [Thermoplasmata archaeon]
MIIVVVLVGVGLGTSWYGLQKSSTSSPGSCASGVTLQGAGASFLNALMSSWKSAYTTATGNMIDYTASGAGAGVTSLADKLVDFAATDEPLNASQVAAMPTTVLTLPVTGGPVVIVYNLTGYSHPLNLTANQLAGIYLGTISNWNSSALAVNNPGLPNQAIIAVHRADQAGTTYVLTNLMSLWNSTWNTTVGTTILPTPWPSTPHSLAEKGNSALAKAIAANYGSIGYVDLPDAINSHLSTAGVENLAHHYIQPTIAATEAAIANLSGQKIPSATGNWSAVSWVNSPGTYDYPLATLSYFFVLKDPSLGYTKSVTDAQVLIQWLHWALTKGQTLSAAVDYVNPPANIVTQDLNALGTMVYSGASIPACT